MFIREHGDSIARRYLDHDVIERHKANLLYIQHQSRLGLFPLTAAEQAASRRAYERAMKRHGPGYGGDYGWAIPKLTRLKPGAKPKSSDIIDAVDMRHMAPYYKLACGRVHAGAHGMLFALGVDPASGLLLVGPSTRGLSEPGQNTALSLAQITSELAEMYPSLDVKLLQAVVERVSQSTMEQFAALAPEPPRPVRSTRRKRIDVKAAKG
jgi:hypothetical protein